MIRLTFWRRRTIRLASASINKFFLHHRLLMMYSWPHLEPPWPYLSRQQQQQQLHFIRFHRFMALCWALSIELRDSSPPADPRLQLRQLSGARFTSAKATKTTTTTDRPTCRSEAELPKFNQAAVLSSRQVPGRFLMAAQQQRKVCGRSVMGRASSSAAA